MATLNKMISSSVAVSSVEVAIPSIADMIGEHVNAQELVICMEFNIGRKNLKGNTIFNIGAGGAYTYKANPGHAFMTVSPMGFTNEKKGDPTSARNYFNNGEFSRVIPAAVSDEEAPDLADLKSSLMSAKTMLKGATAKTRPIIQQMVSTLELQIAAFEQDSFDHEIMKFDDWKRVCESNGMLTGEIKLWFPMPWDQDDINEMKTDSNLKAVRMYFLLSNLGEVENEIYPRKSNKDEKDTLLSANADGTERHGIQITVTPLHMEFLDKTFSHTKQLRMVDPVGFNAAANYFADKDKAKRESTTGTVFESLAPIVQQLNIRAKKLPQCQAKLEQSLETNNVWLSHIERELKMIADSRQFHAFTSVNYLDYISSLKDSYPNAIVDDSVISESELKKVKTPTLTVEDKSPLDVTDDEVDALLSSLI